MIAHIDNEYTMRGKPGVTGNMNRKFSKALGNQCQCDGNCRCGYVKHHRLHCDNCGWSGPESYNALTGKFVCPGCKTENCNNSNNNNQMNNQTNLESSFSQGVVGVGIGNDGFLLWNNNPLGTDVSGLNESGFTQETVAYAIGSQGMSLSPFSENPIGASESGYGCGQNNESGFTQEAVAFAIGEQGMSLNPFGDYESEQEENTESNFLLLGPGALSLRKEIFCGRFCKSLGYMRREDKSAFKKCKASCKINFKRAKKGQWKYPAAPEGIEEVIDPVKLDNESSQAASQVTQQQAQQNVQRANEEVSTEKSKMTMWIIIAVVAVVLIVGAIILVRRKKS